MTISNYLAELTWADVMGILEKEHVVLLPLGSAEAHGPHAPLSTDTIITEAMIRRALPEIEAAGIFPLVLPNVNYGITEYAGAFPGTISLQPETLEAIIYDIGNSLIKYGFKRMFIVNNHFEPEHVKGIYSAAQKISEQGLPVGYLDLTRKKRAALLTAEFKSGDCHAGSYETSIVLAARPGLVKEELLQKMGPLEVSLVSKMSKGLKDFKDIGMDQAYCGFPAAASAEEGNATLKLLSEMLTDAVSEFLKTSTADKPGAYHRF